MSNLKILGAQRVKALIEMLKEKEKEAIATVKATAPTESAVKAQVDEQLGLTKLRADFEKTVQKLRKISDEIYEKTGQTASIRYDHSYGKVYREYERLLVAARGGSEISEKVAAIQKEYRQKEQQLWLCETLEEAKAIVGI
jgi:hypothetical protein